MPFQKNMGKASKDGSPVRLWTKNNGLPSRGVESLGQDRDGTDFHLGVLVVEARGAPAVGDCSRM